MKRANLLILLFLCSQLLSTSYTTAKKLTAFYDLYESPFIIVDKENFYIWDRALLKICIYSKKNYRKITEFGKRGEGPGEFVSINKVFLLSDYICVSSFPKLCFFNKKGKLIKQIKGPSNAGSFIPFGKNFVGTIFPSPDSNSKEANILFCLFDSSLQKKRDIFSTKIHKAAWQGKKKMNVSWVRDCIKALTSKNKLIIGTTHKGLYFEVFDKKGDKLYIINRRYDERKINDNEKRMILDEAKTMWGERRWNNYKMRFNPVFPDFYPAYQNFTIDNNMIYIFLFPMQDTIEVIILDISGNFVGKKEIPKIKYNIIKWGRFDVWDGKLYYLNDNIEEEKWELNEVDLKYSKSH